MLWFNTLPPPAQPDGATVDAVTNIATKILAAVLQANRQVDNSRAVVITLTGDEQNSLESVVESFRGE